MKKTKETYEKHLHPFFNKQHFYKQHKPEIGKKIRRKLRTPWGLTFDKDFQ